MKVTYLGSDTCLRERGKTYDVLKKEGDHITVIAKDGDEWKFSLIYDDFVIVPDNISPIEEKKSQIQEARSTIKELEKQISSIEKELADLSAPKVGDKYEHEAGNKYLVVKMNGLFSLICYYGKERALGLPYSHFTKEIKDIFACFEYKFTKIN